MNTKSGTRRVTAALLVSCLVMPQIVWAQEAVDESPNEWAMVGDLLVARPIGLVLTVGGAAVFLVSLPFTLLAGHAGEAADTLVAGPAETTFMRCLGCRQPGYTNRDSEAIKRREERRAAEKADLESAAQTDS
ncbi:MAG: hypothetical protein GY887_06910 [Halieaceae bacterium]|nr:hypothetical protein [Halieaceae bacterium]MDG2411753.1 hypothetical protein [Halioglobus sp.]